MSEDNVSAGEALAALEKMDKIFKSFEAAKKAVKYLAGLEQNVRELEASVAAAQANADIEQRSADARIQSAESAQVTRLRLLDEEFAAKKAHLEASCKAYQVSVDQAVAASRAEHEELLAQIASGQQVLAEQRKTVLALQQQAEDFEKRVATARETAAKIFEGKL